VVSKKQKQLDQKYAEVGGEIKTGDKVKLKRNQQVGDVLELRGKRAVVKIGLLPMQFDLADLVVVQEREAETSKPA
jgi:DNA mismatch repair protein MutS2